VKTRTKDERRREVQAWRASGETAHVYAARRGYSTTSLHRWCADERASAEPAFVRVEVVPNDVRDAPELVVEVGDARVRVARGFDAEHLRAVVGALSPRAK
jgi:hypothetical protein